MAISNRYNVLCSEKNKPRKLGGEKVFKAGAASGSRGRGRYIRMQRSGTGSTGRDSVNSRIDSNAGNGCRSCGEPGHLKINNTQCLNCGGLGYRSRYCSSVPRGPRGDNSNGKRKERRHYKRQWYRRRQQEWWHTLDYIQAAKPSCGGRSTTMGKTAPVKVSDFPPNIKAL